jgi:hypothetical protein
VGAPPRARWRCTWCRATARPEPRRGAQSPCCGLAASAAPPRRTGPARTWDAACDGLHENAAQPTQGSAVRASVRRLRGGDRVAWSCQ